MRSLICYGDVIMEAEEPDKIIVKLEKKILLLKEQLKQSERIRTLSIENLAKLVKNLHKQVDERTENLRKINEQLKVAQDQMIQSEKLASLGGLIAGVAHEINNPVNFIKSNFVLQKQKVHSILWRLSQLLDDDEGKEVLQLFSRDFDEIEESHKYIATGIERVEKIVSSLSTFVRTSHEFEKGEVNHILDEVLYLLSSQIKNITLQKEYGELPAIDCLPLQLSQVFMNVLLNAIYAANMIHSDLESVVKIKTYTEDDTVIVEISDNGPGIEEKALNKVFDPFVTTKPVGSGSGMGLSISYNIVVELHHGKILASNLENGGALFRIILPIKFL